MQRPNAWRDTGRTARLLIFDALAGIPLILMFLYLRLWTFFLALLCFVVLGILGRMGFSVRVALRRLRAKIAGPVRYALGWRHKHQEKI